MRLRILGMLELGADERGSGAPSVRAVATVPLRSAKLRRLLAALLVRANTVVSIDWLADVLWGEETTVNVEAAVHNLVFRLRGELRAAGRLPDAEGPALLTRPPGYLLCVERGDLDATHFEDLVACARRQLACAPGRAAGLLDEGLALWRGPAYAEFADEDFARAEASRLEEMRAGALEDRVDAALALGCHDEAVLRLEGLLATAPLRERPHAQLMLALHRAGRQADALQVYRDYRTRMGEELGLEPSPALEKLEGDILRQDPKLQWVPRPLDRLESAPESPATAPSVPDLYTAVSGRTGLVPLAVPPRPPDAGTVPSGNLPAHLVHLIGRDDILLQVVDLLTKVRVLTLTGPGGVGKSSLALHAGRAVASPATAADEGFADGVWLVELAPVPGPQAVPDAVATVLAVQQRQGLTGVERLVQYLHPKRMLLVLDNCEHVVEAVAQLVEAVVRGCPGVTVLATSREAVGVAAEHVRPVPPLPVPPLHAAGVADLTRSPSVALFTERATAAAPAFAVSDRNASAVADICRRLDGMPLAIELAATRMRSMTPAEVAERLSGRFHFLRSTRRIAAERHRTLRAVVDWSYGLLDERERRVFDRLSVFAGNFSLAAAECVSGSGDDDGDGADVADLLGGLVDKSMVLASPGNDEVTRYSLLETLRAYGRERLDERDETASARRAHAEYYTAFAEQAGSRLLGPDCAQWAEAIGRNADDLRIAHAWALSHDLGLALRMIAALVEYAENWMPTEVSTWAERTVEAADAAMATGTYASPLLPVICAVAAIGARFRGDLDTAAALAERGLAAAAGPDDPASRYPLDVLCDLALFNGRPAECIRITSEVERLALAAGDRLRAMLAVLNRTLIQTYSRDLTAAAASAGQMRDRAARSGIPLAVAWSHYAEGEMQLDTDPEHAVMLLDDAIAQAKAMGARYLAGVAMVSAASLRARHGDPHRALPLFREVIEHWHQSGNWTQQWTTIRNVVELLGRTEGAHEDAALLYGAVTTRSNAAPAFGADADHLTTVRRSLIERLGEDRFAALAGRGAAMADQAVITHACSALASAARGARSAARLSSS